MRPAHREPRAVRAGQTIPNDVVTHVVSSTDLDPVSMHQNVSVSEAFTEFAQVIEPRLRLALGAAFGFDMAQEATAEALAFAWEHWDRVMKTANPVGYVFGVGRNTARRSLSRLRVPFLPPVRASEMPWVEPGLPGALGRLSERQRAVIMLLHCFEWTFSEVSEVLGMARGTVQAHERRGMARLRKDLGVEP
jgi:DNA-directed RNA polymerase specialized sigma24 family protein